MLIYFPSFPNGALSQTVATVHEVGCVGAVLFERSEFTARSQGVITVAGEGLQRQAFFAYFFCQEKSKAHQPAQPVCEKRCPPLRAAVASTFCLTKKYSKRSSAIILRLLY